MVNLGSFSCVSGKSKKHNKYFLFLKKIKLIVAPKNLREYTLIHFQRKLLLFWEKEEKESYENK